ncbi:hypothetical protein JL721_3384 [Aureococcus anophagefferens]|nr:hypothetical protein JL721_3384 [Aureococcus anophagefferens]
MTSLIVFEAPSWSVEDGGPHAVDGFKPPQLRRDDDPAPAPSDELVVIRVWCAAASCTSRDDEFGGGEGVPLATFGSCSRVSVNRSALLAASRFFRGACRGGGGGVEIKVPSPAFVDAFVLALHDVVPPERPGASPRVGTRKVVAPGEIGPRNAFAMLAVAEFCGLTAVRKAAERVLVATLSARTMLRLAAYASTAADPDARRIVLGACYERLKRRGATADSEKARSDRRVARPLVFDGSALHLHPFGCVNPALFADLIAAELARKRPSYARPFLRSAPPARRGDGARPRQAQLPRRGRQRPAAARAAARVAGRRARRVCRPRDARTGTRTTEARGSFLGQADEPEEDAALAAAAESLAGVSLGEDDDADRAPRGPAVSAQGTRFAEMRRCYLVRRREGEEGKTAGGKKKLVSHFALYDDATLELLATARGVPERATYDFALSTDDAAFRRGHADYLGEARSSHAGSRFLLRDWRVPELPPGCLEALGAEHRAAVTYRANVLGRVPNSMRVATIDGDDVLRFRTRAPKWSDKVQMWTMDFQGRVKRASKKNFQLHLVDDDEVRLLFGKVSKNRFSLDFAPPFAPASALFVALTTFASKLVVA